MAKKLLALDIGNVCIRIDHSNFMKELKIDSISENLRELALKFECGKIESRDFFDRAAELTGHSARRCKEAFEAILIEPVSGMCDLVSQLPAMGIEAVFFSDISTVHLARTEKLFSAFSAVSAGIFSCRVGALKPSFEMLSAFETAHGKPSLYVDDRSDLIEAAGKHGWNAVRFTDAETLRTILSEL